MERIALNHEIPNKNYIQSITIKKDTNERFKKLYGIGIDFVPGLNFIIGENGIGKSSILGSLSNNNHTNDLNVKTTGLVKTYSFDTEKSNPRMQSHFTSGKALYMRFVSHGESILSCLEEIKTIDINKDSYCIFIDEPESGLSPWNQKKLRKMYEELSYKMQFIIATHSLIITKSGIGRLIELKRKKVTYFDPPNSYNWKVI
jgi:predicted ATPase